MSKRSNKEFILDMYIACSRILDYTKELSEVSFYDDIKTQDAVIRNLEILGEASKKISNEFHNKYPFIEWSLIAKTRDKLIHDYFGIDLEVVWDIAKNDIPILKDNLFRILKSENWEKLI